MGWSKGRRKYEKSAQENKYLALNCQAHIRFAAKLFYFSITGQTHLWMAWALISYSFSHNRKLTREKWQMQFLSIKLCLEELKIFSFHAFKFLLYTIVFLRGLYLIPWSFPCQDSPASLWNKSRHWSAGTTRETAAALGPPLPAGFCCSACKGHLSMA